eukprot:6485079-Amphidinium_carterae.1
MFHTHWSKLSLDAAAAAKLACPKKDKATSRLLIDVGGLVFASVLVVQLAMSCHVLRDKTSCLPTPECCCDSVVQCRADRTANSTNFDKKGALCKWTMSSSLAQRL